MKKNRIYSAAFVKEKSLWLLKTKTNKQLSEVVDRIRFERALHKAHKTDLMLSNEY